MASLAECPDFAEVKPLTYADYIHTPIGTHQRDLTITAVYDAEYVRSRYEAIDANVRALSARRLAVLYAFAPRRGMLLDFGAGSFRFVEAAIAAGWFAWGYDIAGQHHANFWDYKRGWPKFDVVTFFDSLEHLPDPAGLVGELAPRVVMVSVPECHYPNTAEWFMDWKHRRPGEHLWHWNRRTLPAFMARLGYQCEMLSWFEDEFRPNHDQAEPNILTGIFTRQ